MIPDQLHATGKFPDPNMFRLLRGSVPQQKLRSFIKPLAGPSWQIRYKSWEEAWGPEVSETDLEAARKWRSEFNQTSIDRRPGIITTSRSSGPGGQHVNT